MRQLFFAILMMLPIATNAQNVMTGNEIQQRCVEGHELELYCVGYIEGLVTVMLFTNISGNFSLFYGGRQTKEFCMPTGVTAGQRRDTILKWLQDHPEDRHNASAWLVYRALYDAFPCT